MQPFTVLTAIAAPLPLMNVDTDMIIPKQFLKTIKRTGLGKHAFDEMRYKENGEENPDFVLNQAPYRQAQILIADENFGCGSSREHAPWALLDFGIRCVIAPSFADIFYNNCFKNGILPIVLPKEQVMELMQKAQNQPEAQMVVDLQKQEIRAGNHSIAFNVDNFKRNCLIKGLDDIGLTLQHMDAISQFEEKRASTLPWLHSAA